MTTNYRGYQIKAIQYPAGDWRATATYMGEIVATSDENGDFQSEEEAISSCQEAVNEFCNDDQYKD